MNNNKDIPLKLVSTAGTASAFYAIGTMLYPYADDMKIWLIVLVGTLISYSFTFVGMSIYAKNLDTKGIYKLSIIISLLYVMNTPTVYSKAIDISIDGRYSTLKNEYDKLPVYDPKRVDELREKQKIAIEKYKADIKDSYNKYIKAEKENINYSYFANIRAERANMKSFTDKRNSEYTKLVNECSGYDLSQKSRSVALCQKDLKVRELKTNYERDRNIATKEYGVYIVNNIPHTHLYEEEIIANSSEVSQSIRDKKKKELEDIESKFVPMWMVGIIVFVVGFLFESRVANMSVFAEADIHRKRLKGEINVIETLKSKKSETVKSRLENERANIERILSSQDDMLRLMYSVLFIDNSDSYKQQEVRSKVRVKHATFFAVLKAIMEENPPHLGMQKKGFGEKRIQSYMTFVNPKKKVPFSVKNYHVKIRELIEKEQGVRRINNEWIFDFIAIKKILKQVDKLK